MDPNKHSRRKVKFSVRFINWLVSGFYFALTFIFFHYLGHVLTSVFAARFGYQVSFSYAGMDTLMYTTGWTVNRIAIVYVLPSVICLFIGMVSYLFYRKMPTVKIHFRTLFVWLTFNGFTFYFSHIISGLFSGFQFNSEFFTAFVSYYAWLGWEGEKVISVLVLQALFSAPLVYFLVRPYHELSYSNQLMASRSATKKWREFLLFPIAFGVALIALATFPMNVGFSAIRIFSALLLSLFMLLFMNFKASGNYKIVQGGFVKTPKLMIGSAIIALIMFCQFALSIQLEL